MYGPQTKMSEEFHEIQPNYRKSTFPIDLVTMFFCFNPPICVVQKCVQHHVFHESQPKHGPLLLKSPKNHYPLRWWSRTSSAPSLVKVPPTLQGASLWPSHDGKMGGATTCTWDAMDGNHPKIGREVMQTCGKCQEMRGRNALNFTELMFLRQKKFQNGGLANFHGVHQCSWPLDIVGTIAHQSWGNLGVPKFETPSDVCLFNWFDHVWTINHCHCFAANKAPTSGRMPSN